MKKKKIISIFAIIAVLVVIIGGGYTRYSLNNIVANNNRQNADENKKLEVVKGSQLKIGDYVNYDHTLQVDPNTKETTSVPKDKLTYTSIKGDLDNSGNGYGTQTVDVSGYETRWIVLDINENGEVLLLPERNRDLQYIKGKGALSYLYLENEMHKLAGLYGHGYGADETKVFEYEVGSRIPSEKDTRKEHTKGTGARAMLIDDVEVPFGITTDDRRQELNDDTDKEKYPIGSNKLEKEIYYPTLNKEHADMNGLSINKKNLNDIKQEYYSTYKILDLNTNKYNKETGEDRLKIF